MREYTARELAGELGVTVQALGAAFKIENPAIVKGVRLQKVVKDEGNRYFKTDDLKAGESLPAAERRMTPRDRKTALECLLLQEKLAEYRERMFAAWTQGYLRGWEDFCERYTSKMQARRLPPEMIKAVIDDFTATITENRPILDECIQEASREFAK